MNNSAALSEDLFYWPIEIVTSFIAGRQTDLLQSRIPELEQRFSDAVKRLGKTNPEITDIKRLFSENIDRLKKEMRYDVNCIFPYLNELSDCHNYGRPVKIPAFSSIAGLTPRAVSNHRAVTDIIKTVAGMISTFNEFTSIAPCIPELPRKLNELADELEFIAHIRFTVLFPRAAGLENTVERISPLNRYSPQKH